MTGWRSVRVGLELGFLAGGLGARCADQADVPAAVLDRDDAARPARCARPRVGLDADHGPVLGGDGGAVDTAGVRDAGVDAVLRKAGDAQLGQPVRSAGRPAGGVDDQIRGQLGLGAVRRAQPYAGDAARTPQQSRDFGVRAHGDARVLQHLPADHGIREVAAGGDQVVAVARPAAVPALGRVDHHVRRHRHPVGARAQQLLDGARQQVLDRVRPTGQQDVEMRCLGNARA